MMLFDAVIIGGGPAGSQSAKIIAEHGFKTLVIEEDSEVGKPQHCAGLISISGLHKLGLNESKPFVLNKINGARFFAPNTNSFIVSRNDYVAVVIDRILFDKFLEKNALSAGAEYIYNTKAISISRKQKKWKIKAINRRNGEKKSIFAKIIIDAEGRIGAIRRFAGLTHHVRILPAFQYVVGDVSDLDEKLVELYFDTDLAKDFFLWVIPISKNAARVGLATSKGNPKALLDQFITKSNYSYKFSNVKTLDAFGGGVITSGPIPKYYAPGFLVVGDAAGHVKPTTGGGIILGGICAKIAAEVAIDALEKDIFLEKFLAQYQRRCNQILGKHFKSMKIVRWWLNKLSNKGYNRLFKYIKEKEITNLLELYGDMDMQEGVIKKLLLNPKFLINLLYTTLL